MPAFKADVPHVLVTVELEEGPWMNASLVGNGREPTDGAAVTCRFDAHDDRWTFPSFVLVYREGTRGVRLHDQASICPRRRPLD
ncbi:MULTISPECIES: hypothetical protein [unclassified Bradyrhizobium]|uniref:hypothetical protein n=1 Tax=unclassified Bradyrhizobium TaxID=2631580 RepID=UPI0035C6F876